MKILRTIRFDGSDSHVYEQAAAPDEWAISGAFSFWDWTDADLTGKHKQAFANGFLGLSTFGRSTFVAVGEAGEGADGYEAIHGGLVDHLVRNFGAPSKTDAHFAATQELAFAQDLAAHQSLNTLLAISRKIDSSGEIREQVRTVAPPDGNLHTRIWDVVEDE